jgi:hypothetical protein
LGHEVFPAVFAQKSAKMGAPQVWRRGMKRKEPKYVKIPKLLE